jgi:hypothetical protein
MWGDFVNAHGSRGCRCRVCPCLVWGDREEPAHEEGTHEGCPYERGLCFPGTLA